MASTLEVLLSPADYQARRQKGFADAVCVVFDVLRATSVMIEGLANGAAGFVPMEDISEALARRTRHPDALLAGERNGLRINAAQSGGVEFNLGNSPREYTPERVRGRIIITTTTNGTRALRACDSAPAVAVATFSNLTATADWLAKNASRHLVLVCAGTGESAALEDVLGAGALCELLAGWAREDSAEIARRTYLAARGDLLSAVINNGNGKRLWAQPDLREDVEVCLRRDVHPFAALLGPDGIVRRAV
jgi:2-phosphosulfolactate phosphatase